MELPAELSQQTWDALKTTRISGQLIELKRDSGPPSARAGGNRRFGDKKFGDKKKFGKKPYDKRRD